jgi:rhodanese-related sulfurtransferase
VGTDNGVTCREGVLDVFGQPSVPQVDADSVPPEATVLDVRERWEWVAGHVGGALHVPMHELPARTEEVPHDVVVVCRSGSRSAQVTAWLVAQGWQAVNLDGGLLAWERRGRPLVSETDEPPTVA